MQQYLGPIRDEQGYRALFGEHLKRRYENALGRSLDAHPRSWRPSVTLEGAKHLQDALSRRMGAIVWGMSFLVRSCQRWAYSKLDSLLLT